MSECHGKCLLQTSMWYDFKIGDKLMSVSKNNHLHNNFYIIKIKYDSSLYIQYNTVFIVYWIIDE